MDILQKEAFLSYKKQILLKINMIEDECMATRAYACLIASYLKRFSLSMQKQLSIIAWKSYSTDRYNCIDLALSINRENRECLENFELDKCCKSL